MKKIPLVLWVGLASLVILLSVGVMFFRLQTSGSILSVGAESPKGSMYFEGENRVGIHQPFKVRVMIDSGGGSVNAAGLYLHFDPQKLQITDMSTINSFCQFYPEKKFDNHQGISSLACGSPHPGTKGTNQLVEFTFTPLSVGKTIIRSSSKSKLLLSDGKGTDILNDYPLWEVQIGASL
jgi:hypothetical protein